MQSCHVPLSPNLFCLLDANVAGYGTGGYGGGPIRPTAGAAGGYRTTPYGGGAAGGYQVHQFLLIRRQDIRLNM